MVYYTYEIRLGGHSGFFWSFTITEKKKKVIVAIVKQ